MKSFTQTILRNTTYADVILTGWLLAFGALAVHNGAADWQHVGLAWLAIIGLTKI